MKKLRVLLLESIHQRAVEVFAEHGYEVQQIPGALSSEELNKMDWDVLGIRSQTRIKRRLFFDRKRLAIGAFCIGTNQIDLTACGDSGCMVFNDRYSNSRSVAELTVTNLGILFRGLFDKSSQMHAGIWNKSSSKARTLRGKVLGIVGYGNIGQQVGALAEHMGMKVVFFDLEEKSSLGNAKKCNSLEELLSQSDAVTLHVDGRESNRKFFGKELISKMKPGGFLLNLSRGFIIDVEELARALKDKGIGGAALDVHETEPNSTRDIFRSPLAGISNTILTPHIGGSTEEAQFDIAANMATRMINYLKYGAVESSPLFPRESFNKKLYPHTNRIIYIHQNIPGQIEVAAGILAKQGLNVSGLELFTNKYIGYAIYDVAQMSQANSRRVAKRLNDLDGCIQVRIL